MANFLSPFHLQNGKNKQHFPSLYGRAKIKLLADTHDDQSDGRHGKVPKTQEEYTGLRKCPSLVADYRHEGTLGNFPLLKQLHHKFLHQTSQQPPMKRNPPLFSGENKPETPELFKAGVTDAVIHMGREARYCRWDTRRPSSGWFTDLTPSG